MKTVINIWIALGLTMILGSCKAQIYNAKYTNISVASFNGEQFDLSVWLSVDTFNIKSNNCIVVVERLSITSDKQYSYIESKTIKSNVTSTQADNIERILIDNKNQIVYFLDSKVAFNCKDYEIKKTTYQADSTYTNKLEKGENLGIIKLSTSIPKEIRGKLISSNSTDGVLEILTNNQKMNLIGFEKVEKFDFNSIITEAKETCKLNEKQLDLIFPR